MFFEYHLPPKLLKLIDLENFFGNKENRWGLSDLGKKSQNKKHNISIIPESSKEIKKRNL